MQETCQPLALALQSKAQVRLENDMKEKKTSHKPCNQNDRGEEKEEDTEREEANKNQCIL